MARDCSSYNFVRTDLCGEKEKIEKRNSTNSHEAHGKRIPRTHAKVSKNIRKNRIIRLNRLFSDVKTGLYHL